ncbi:C39 family peptidase [Nocardiopsis sp. JB363]|uniref:C39 family peptidase n=1 Tax=Nocardiopsis sp. JB363 TaxID=1434837 RepID=UPI00097A4191|nr:C39 family peptidase [Nocardiopsis sp. JB363]SIO88512.1 hypothetical protein BQ8420_19240 [Nocardiopsis sp. JB363]
MHSRCGACTGLATLHDPVPAITQYASPGLIERIAYQGYAPGEDPAWKVSGAASRGEYARWCRHACGMASLRMVLVHRDGHAPPLMELLHEVRRAGGYLEQADGSVKGLVYAPFVEYVRGHHGLDAQVRTDLDTTAMRAELDRGRMVLVSVHKEIRRPHLPPPGKGGHLVLVIGHRNGRFHIRNPSGHTPDAVSAVLSASEISQFSTERGIVVDPTGS